MKKLVILLSCFLAVLACSKEQNKEQDFVSDNLQVFERPVITVSSEGQTTKAYLGAADGLGNCDMLWSLSDKIGVHVYSGINVGREKGGINTSWTVDPKDVDKKSGAFSADSPIDGALNYSYAAYYPFDTHNIGGDARFYCAYKNSYSGYVPGRIISPMVANMNADGLGLERRSTNIALKHVGATVKITLNNVPAEANKLVLTISNNNITGWGGVDPSDAGTAYVSPSGLSAGEGVTVTHSVALNFDEGVATRNGLVFYFPVPVLTAPTIQVDLYVDSVIIWSKSSSNAQPNVGRGEVLVMPALNVSTPTVAYVLNEVGTIWDGANTAFHVVDVSSWPGWTSTRTETFGSYTYQKYFMPTSAAGASRTINFTSASDNNKTTWLGDVTITAGQNHFFRTDGVSFRTVTVASSPEALPHRVCAYSDEIGDNLKVYGWKGDNLYFGGWRDSANSMTKADAKMGASVFWYYKDLSDGQYVSDSNLIFINDWGGVDCHQTPDISSVDLSSNKFYYIYYDNGNLRALEK